MNKILYGLILLAITAMIFGSTGCKSPEKIASKRFYKAMDKDAVTVYKECSKVAPPVTVSKDSFIYKQGKTIYKKGDIQYVTVDCDSIIKSGGTVKRSTPIRIPCPPCDSVRVDTQYVSKGITIADRSKEYALKEENEQAKETITKLKLTNKWLWIAFSILGAYTIVRLIVKAKFKINLP